MKTQTRFKDLASGQRFRYLGRPFIKTAFSLAVDETNDEFIFMGEIGVEPLWSATGWKRRIQFKRDKQQTIQFLRRAGRAGLKSG